MKRFASLFALIALFMLTATQAAFAVPETLATMPLWVQSAHRTILYPDIAFLLVTLGFYGVVYELAQPGTFFAGVVGIILMILGLYAMSILPTSLTGLALLLLGLTLMTAEAFITAKGILGIGGAIAFVLGAYFLFDSEDPKLRLSWVTIIATAIVVCGGLTALLIYAARHYRAHDPKAFDAKGRDGIILSWTEDDRRIEYDGAIWNATSQSNTAYHVGDAVRIHDRDNLTIILP